MLAGEPSEVDVNSVAESGQPGSLHPKGAPIIHSTNQGLRRRSVDRFPSLDGGLVLAPLHSYATSLNVVPGLNVESGDRSGAVVERLLRLSLSTGVGSSFTSEGSEGRTAAPSLGDWLLPYSVATGVGSKRIASCSRYGVQPGLLRRNARRCPSLARGVGSKGSVAIWSLRSFDRSGFVHRSGSPTAPDRRLPSHAVGVASNGNDAVTEVRGAEGCRWKAVPLDIEAERGQLPDNLSPDGSIVESKDVRHVLHEHVSGLQLANGSGHLAPQNGLGVVHPVALADGAGALAGEAAGDDVDSNSVSASELSDVGVDDGTGESPREEFAAEGDGFAEPCVAQSGLVQPEVEQSAA